jgi:hypothetical protein
LDSIIAERSWAAAPGFIRVYWDADDDTSYQDYRVVGDALTGFNPEKMEESWLGLWTIGLDRLVVVP